VTIAQPRGRRLDLVQSLHASTKRDYIARVVEHDKAECAMVASQFGADYWDGERRFGYGGYHYDGRWATLAERLAGEYGLRAGQRVLDVGCGKGYLLYELTRTVPGIEIVGLDISRYALDHAKPEVAESLVEGDAAALPFADASFDLVVSLGALHNLPISGLFAAIGEIERVTKPTGGAYVMVESYRDEREKANLLYWQLTCKSFYGVDEWAWIYAHLGYRGDYGFIFFT
jgi:protein-L-isoaspartate(D-aspartate) O-methyltransferase